MVNKGRAPHILTAIVEELWASQTLEEQRAAPPEIHRLTISRFGEKSISLRTVQNIVRDLESQPQFEVSADDPDWLPWVGPETPDETALLMELDLQSKIWLDRPLQQIEAMWAVRIAPSVTELCWFTHWTLARQYAHRERLASLLGDQAPPNEFLNTLLAIKPWIDGRHELWTTAVQVGFSEWQQKLFYDIAPFDTRPDLVEAVYRDLNLSIEDWALREPFDEDWTLRELQSLRVVDDEDSVILQFDPEIDLGDDLEDDVESDSEPESEADDDIAAGEYIGFDSEPGAGLALVGDEAGAEDDEPVEIDRDDILEFELGTKPDLTLVDDEVGEAIVEEDDELDVDPGEGATIEDEEPEESFEELQRRIERFLQDNEPE